MIGADVLFEVAQHLSADALTVRFFSDHDPVEVPGAIRHRGGSIVSETEDLAVRFMDERMMIRVIGGMKIVEDFAQGLDLHRSEHGRRLGQGNECWRVSWRDESNHGGIVLAFLPDDQAHGQLSVGLRFWYGLLTR